jgi:hypothetical protein
MDCAPDYEIAASLIADLPPRLAQPKLGWIFSFSSGLVEFARAARRRTKQLTGPAGITTSLHQVR